VVVGSMDLSAQSEHIPLCRASVTAPGRSED
jgi:hypothetical protein